MSRILSSGKSGQFTIEDTPIHKGGEGAIHRVISSGRNLVAKIYHTTDKAQSFHQKIQYMVDNPPFNGAPEHIRDAIVWPMDLLFENKVFVGYLMPMVEQGIKLYSLTLPGSLKEKFGDQWGKFDKTHPDALLVRMKVCYNLAKAIHLLHQTGRYVFVDLKPENVLIKPNGFFSIIDLDSVQISHKQQLLYKATAFTSDYAPPEFHQGMIDFFRDTIPFSFDFFSMAVVFYKVLLLIHPFQASHNKYNTLEENIQHGLFVHGSKRDQLLVIRPVHHDFNKLPKSIRKLFLRALDHGFVNPDFRPGPDEWAAAFLTEVRRYIPGKYSCFSSKINCTGGKSPSQPARPQPITHLNKNERQQTPSYNKLGNAAAKNVGQPKTFKRFPIHKKRILKKAAMVMVLILSGLALWDMVASGKIYTPEPQAQVSESVLVDHLAGTYYGFLCGSDMQKQVAYLQIIQSPVDSQRFAMKIITSVQKGALVEEIVLDVNNDIINTELLGQGNFALGRNGGATLVSNEKNDKLWYFEK